MLLPRLRRPRARATPAYRQPPCLEPLEGRDLPSTFLVTNTSDSATAGSGSLRAALLASNASPPPAGSVNVIDFAIPGAGAHAIAPASALPAVTAAVLIDGASQPGFVQANAPQVVLQGNAAGTGVNGLTLSANGCTVRGLAVDNFSGDGIQVGSSGNVIVADYLGVDATGTALQSNRIGVAVTGGTNNVIQNDLLSGNVFDGAFLGINTAGTLVSANLIGTDITGTRPLGNNSNGVIDEGVGDRFTGNVISGNAASGLHLAGPASGSMVANNLIGTDLSGSRALPNGVGVELEGATAATVQSNLISGNSGDGIVLDEFVMSFGGNDRDLVLNNLVGVTLGGAQPLGNGHVGIDVNGATNCVVAGNTVAANATGGIALNGISSATNVVGNAVVGNRVGTDAGGGVAVGNGGLAGVVVLGQAVNNTIDSNLIAGNLLDGVLIRDSGTTGNVVWRNYVGAAVGGAALPNGLHGVEIDGGAAGNTVSGNIVWFNRGHGVLLHDAGTTANVVQSNNVSFNAGAGVLDLAGAAGNVIGLLPSAFGGMGGNVVSANGQAGVWVDGAATTGVSILGNAIVGNGGLGGIALTNGANKGQAPPALAYAVNAGPNTTAVGTIQGQASTQYRLELFDNPSGGGEGQVFLGAFLVTTDASGGAAFAEDLSGALTSVTATLTDPGNDTSVLSAPVGVVRL